MLQYLTAKTVNLTITVHPLQKAPCYSLFQKYTFNVHHKQMPLNGRYEVTILILNKLVIVKRTVLKLSIRA